MRPCPNIAINNIGKTAVCLLALLAAAGCDKMVQSSNTAVSVTERAFNDTKSSWLSFFTYHPEKPAPGPQTRYCYQLQSDVVCYDSIQYASTSKLLGYQDGEKISWVQPGGGSLGVSGGDPTVTAATPRNSGAAGSVANAAPYAPAFVTQLPDPASKVSAKNLPPAK